jgi:N6-L-threonylcarbamoyladenine synthase
LKTSVLRYVQKKYGLDLKVPNEDLPDLAASFQASVVKALIQNTEKALNEFDVKSISLVGGVAANKPLRNEFNVLAEKYKKKLVIPDIIFCGDNAAMIAYRGLKLHQAGRNFSLNYNAFPGLSVNYFQTEWK